MAEHSNLDFEGFAHKSSLVMANPEARERHPAILDQDWQRLGYFGIQFGLTARKKRFAIFSSILFLDESCQHGRCSLSAGKKYPVGYLRRIRTRNENSLVSCKPRLVVLLR